MKLNSNLHPIILLQARSRSVGTLRHATLAQQQIGARQRQKTTLHYISPMLSSTGTGSRNTVLLMVLKPARSQATSTWWVHVGEPKFPKQVPDTFVNQQSEDDNNNNDKKGPPRTAPPTPSPV
ncbi:hypothetical protein EYF80_020554 [Liparis tanakae]|uniref:Uncharacterized protein n=1 Tax=Liparis tanakae TaxID=230148 RepID=A0A4Z2HU85_9TELE|nr:hypothetical protein EYF80_020554 [Liparis tanakae]